MSKLMEDGYGFGNGFCSEYLGSDGWGDGCYYLCDTENSIFKFDSNLLWNIEPSDLFKPPIPEYPYTIIIGKI